MSAKPVPVLEIEHLTMQFGGVIAVNDFSMHINEGEIVALIGPNGAGKTTAFNCVTGVYEPTNGQVLFNGQPIARNHPAGKMKKLYAGQAADQYLDNPVRLTPDKITQLGIARTFQNIRLFSGMTVFDNVLLAMHLRRRSNFITQTLHLNAAEERRCAKRRKPCFGPWTCGTCGKNWPPACPTEGRGSWKSPAPWRRSPSSCCWMSRRPA